MNKQEIRVLLVGPIPPPYGGIPTYVKNLLGANIEGVNFSLFNTAFPEKVIPSNLEGKRSYSSIFEGSIWIGIKKVFYVLFSFLDLMKTIYRKRPDLIQIFTCTYWGYWRNFGYLVLAKIFRKKTIFHILGAIDNFYEEVGLSQKFLLRKTLNFADCYLLQSPNLEKWARSLSNRIVLGLWNGIDFMSIPPENISEMGFEDPIKKPVGLTIGSLGNNKGTPEILEVIEKLNNENIYTSWIFVGRGDQLTYINWLKKKNISDRVFFLGEVDESIKWQLLYFSDFFCLPSHAEGQPISIIEAMACKLPVISTKVGSIPEMIIEGYNGFLVNPGDINELKESVIKIIQNDEFRKTLGNNAYNICIQRHDINHLYHGLKKIYLRLLQSAESISS